MYNGTNESPSSVRSARVSRAFTGAAVGRFGARALRHGSYPSLLGRMKWERRSFLCPPPLFVSKRTNTPTVGNPYFRMITECGFSSNNANVPRRRSRGTDSRESRAHPSPQFPLVRHKTILSPLIIHHRTLQFRIRQFFPTYIVETIESV